MTRQRAIVGLVVVLTAGSVGWFLWRDHLSNGAVLRTTESFGSGQMLLVALRDGTGLVTSIQPEAFGDGGGASAAPDGPNAILVTWNIRGCDVGTDLAFDRLGTGYRLDVRLDHGIRIGSCPAGQDLYTFAGARITFTQPVSPDAITFAGDTSPWP